MKLRAPGDIRWSLASPAAIKGIIFGLFFAATAQVLVAQSAPHVPQGVVSDWTHHHVLYPDSNDEAVLVQIRKDPRWTHDWYLRHREAWWPEYHPEASSPDENSDSEWVREHRHEPPLQDGESHRDWSVPLGTAPFSPTINFSFTISTETAFGSLNVTDEGSGKWLATSGSLTVTGGSDVGTWTLIPGGAGGNHEPLRKFPLRQCNYPVYESGPRCRWTPIRNYRKRT
jgi:hypothetical protein